MVVRMMIKMIVVEMGVLTVGYLNRYRLKMVIVWDIVALSIMRICKFVLLIAFVHDGAKICLKGFLLALLS